MSKTRQRFIEVKKAKRQQRADDAYERAHSFWCQGRIEGRDGLKPCKWQVMFRHEAEGAKATCRRCGTLHIFDQPMTATGFGPARWMTEAEYRESVPEPESIQVIEVEDDKVVRLTGHAAWCNNRDKDLFGATGTWSGRGKIIWRMGGRFWHTCLSSQAASDIAYARWG